MPKIVLKSNPLGETRERYRALFESNMLGIATSDFDEKILEANDAFLDLVGYSRRDVQSGHLTWSAITPAKYQAIDKRKIRELLKHDTITPFEKEYIHKKGHLVPVLVGAAVINVQPPLGVCFALSISELKKLEKRKDEFIGTVSHELRTPLAVLKMQVSLMREELKADAKPNGFESSIEELDSQIDRLSALLTDLHTLARYTSDHEFFNTKIFDVQACVESVVADVSLIEKRKILLRKTKGEFLVNGNESHISRVFINIINNALRYSPEDSKVVVSIRGDTKKVRICVQDFGIGISKKYLKKIFERNYRVDHSSQNDSQASGIGLYVSREIIKHHRGSITVVSKEGKGSTFCCSLPLYRR